MGDGDEELGESGGVVIGAVGQEKIDIIGRDDAALRGFGDLDDGEQGVALTGVLVDDRQREVRTAGTQAGEVLDPVIGFARDDVEAGGGEWLAVSERGVRWDRAEEGGGEAPVGEQRIAFGEEHRAAAVEDLLGDGDEVFDLVHDLSAFHAEYQEGGEGDVDGGDDNQTAKAAGCELRCVATQCLT